MTNPDSGRCCVCGRFVSWSADQGTRYGRATDMEPPDPMFYCERCADARKARAIANGRVIDCWYIKPEWALDAQAEIDANAEEVEA